MHYCNASGDRRRYGGVGKTIDFALDQLLQNPLILLHIVLVKTPLSLDHHHWGLVAGVLQNFNRSCCEESLAV